MDQALVQYLNDNLSYLKSTQAQISKNFDSYELKPLKSIPNVDPAWTTAIVATTKRETNQEGKATAQRKSDLWTCWDIIPDAPSKEILYSYTFKPGSPDAVYRGKDPKGKANLFASIDLFDVNTLISLLPFKYSDVPEDELVGVTSLEPAKTERTVLREINKLLALNLRSAREASPRGRLKMRNLLLILAVMANENKEWNFAMKYLSAAKHYVITDLGMTEPFIEYQTGDVKILADDCLCPIRLSVLVSAAYRSMNWGNEMWIQEVTALLFHSPYSHSLAYLKPVSSLLQGMTAYSPSQFKVSSRMRKIMVERKLNFTQPVEKQIGDTYETVLPLLGEPNSWFKSYDVLECDSVQTSYVYTTSEFAFSELNKERVNETLEILLDLGLNEYACAWWMLLTAVPSKEVVQWGVRLHSVLEWAGYTSQDTVLAHADTLSKGAIDSSKQDLQVLRPEITTIVDKYMKAMPESELWTGEQYRQAIPRNMTNNSGGRGSFSIAAVNSKFRSAEYIPAALKDKYSGPNASGLTVASQSSKRAWWYLLGADMIKETFQDVSLLTEHGGTLEHITVVRLERTKQVRAAYAVRVEETIPDFFFSYIANYVQSHSGLEDSTLEGWPYMINQSRGSMITDIPVFVKATSFASTRSGGSSRIIFSLDFTSWDLRLTIVDKVNVVLSAFKVVFDSEPNYRDQPFLWDDDKPYTYGQLCDMAKTLMIGAPYTSAYLYHEFKFNASFMPSGKKFTLNFNSLINHAIANYVFGMLKSEYGIAVVNGRIQGDDNMWLVEVTDLTVDKYNAIANRLVELCNSVGLEINIYKSVIRGNEFEFAKLYALAGMIFQPLTVSLLKSEGSVTYVRTMEFFRALSGLALIASMRGEDTKVHAAYLTAAFAIRGSELMQEKDSRSFVFYPPIMLIVPKAYQGVGMSPVTDNADTLYMTIPDLKEWILYYNKELMQMAPDKGFAAQFGEAIARNAMECTTVVGTDIGGNKVKVPLTLDWLEKMTEAGVNINKFTTEMDPSKSAFIVPTGKYKGEIPYLKGVTYAIDTLDRLQLNQQITALSEMRGKVTVPREYYYSNYWYLDTISAVSSNDQVRKIDFESRKQTGRLILRMVDRKGTDTKKEATALKVADVISINYIEAKTPNYEGASVFVAATMGRLPQVLNKFGISALSVPDQFATPLRQLNSSTTFNGNVAIAAIVNLVNQNLHVLFDKKQLVNIFVSMGASESVASNVASKLNIATIATAVINSGYAYNGSINAVLNMSEARLKSMITSEGSVKAGDAFLSRVRRLGEMVAASGIQTIYMWTGKEMIASVGVKGDEYGRYLDKTTNIRGVFGDDVFDRLVKVQSYWAR